MMQRLTLPRLGGVAAATLLLGFIVGRYILPASTASVPLASSPPPAELQSTIWTCSMHPQIRQPAPGDCPICGMDLIPLIDESTDEGPRTLTMSASARALADIQTHVVRRAFPVARIRMVGKLGYDETREKSLTARFPARIDELFVNYTGIRVDAGQHLAEVYSPELLGAQRELLTAHAFGPDSDITRAAAEKLRLWGLLPEQIAGILDSVQARDRFVLRAPIGGIVVSKNVQEGDYVTTGQSMFRIVDLSQLWLTLDAYESDLAWIRYGQDVTFTVQAFPGESFHGRIVFIDPEVDQRTRTVPVRVNVPNDDGRLKPGMFARGTVEARIATGGRVYAPELAGRWISPMHPEIVKDGPGTCDICGMALVRAEELGYVRDVDTSAPLVVPASAVLRTGRRAVVYVEVPDAARPTYEGREIVLGPRAGDDFIVASGLEAGDRVVTHGAFKIDSALQIQAKPSMMSPAGGGPAPGHHHGGSAPAAPAAEPAHLAIQADLLPSLLEPYLDVQAALAGDDLEAARQSLRAMMAVTGHAGPLPARLHEMLAAPTLEALRVPHFAVLSQAMIAAARSQPAAAGGPLLLLHCPMARDNRGADWLQRSATVRNPYFGAMMLSCGEVTDTLAADDTGHDSHGH